MTKFAKQVWPPEILDHLDGKTYLIKGANTGVGFLLLLGIFLFLSCSSLKSSKKLSIDQILGNGMDWKQIQEDQTTIYYKDKSETAKDISIITLKTLKGINQAKNFLGEAYSRPINIVTVDNFEDIEKIVGRKTSGTAYHENDLVVEISGVSFTCHEKFHVLSLNKWGKSKIWLMEGMAVACDKEWWGYELHSLANYLLEKNKFIPFDKMTKNNSSFKKENDLFSYPQSGSMVLFIEQKYGRDKLKELWKSGDFQKSLGKSITAFEEEWKHEIKKHSLKEINYLEKINSNSF